MNPRTTIPFVLDFVLLPGGAEILIRGTSPLALRLRLTPLMVGLTIVALDTSAPEIAVTLHEVRSGVRGLWVDNVVGSNIFNVLCVLGLAGMAAPLVVPSRLVHLDVPVMIGCSVLVSALAVDGTLGRLEGGALLFLGACYLAVLLGHARAAGGDHGVDPEQLPGERPGSATAAGVALDLALVIAGLLLLAPGASWLVDGAAAMVRKADLTAVVAGTSLPAFATSVVASLRGPDDG